MPDVERDSGGPLHVSGREQFDQLRMQLDGRVPVPPFAPTPDFVIDVVEGGYGFLNHDKFKAGFAADAGDADAAFLRDSQVPINMSSRRR